VEEFNIRDFSALPSFKRSLQIPNKHILWPVLQEFKFRMFAKLFLHPSQFFYNRSRFMIRVNRISCQNRSRKMAKPLVLQYGDRMLSFVLNKIDRAALYGHKELEVLNEDGKVCELATLADDGRTVVGPGGTGLAYISADRQWCDKAKLKPIGLEGNEITPVSSSFNAPIPLGQQVSVNDYLDHKIRLVYCLTSEDDVSQLSQELARGTIFSFPYSYRGGLQADAGFLLASDGKVFMAVGNRTDMQYIGLQQSSALTEDDADDDETDLMDFDMM
jgi:hypothetical protein